MKKRVLLTFVIGVCLTTLFSVSMISAASVEGEYFFQVATNKSKNMAEPRATVLEMKYRVYNGYLQYRRWDATHNRWYDSEWITIGPV